MIYKPDYKGGSIVNLMSSISKAFNTTHPYPTLKTLSPSEIKKAKNVVLLVIDGLGFEYLKTRKDSFLYKNMKSTMTSVFPPTTGAAIPTFLTGVPPQQHASTGWYVYLKELGVVSAILPFTPRVGGVPFTHLGISVESIISQKPLSEKLNTKVFHVTRKEIHDSDFTVAMAKKAKILSYSSLNGFFRQIKKAVSWNKKKKYVFGYWDSLDSLNHKQGEGSAKANKHFSEIDKKLKKFSESLKETNTLLVITSDHGFINIPKEKRLWLEDHPKLKETLSMPLSGEPRAAYCYVKPGKEKDFERYVKKHLSKYCYLVKSKIAIKQNYFGLFTPDPKLFERAGDYILIMKENYILRDRIVKKKKKEFVAHHGGVSKNEMIVPLIIVKA